MDEQNITHFEDLPSKEQKEKLENVMSQIKLLHRAEVISATYEIVDVSYNVLSSGQVVYDVTITDPINRNNFIHEFYKEGENQTLTKVDFIKDEDLQKYKLLGLNTKSIEDEQSEIKSLPNNPKKVSLNKLEKQSHELEKTAKDLGIPKDDVLLYSKLDANEDLGFDASKIPGIKSTQIDGNTRVSTHYTMNDVVGLNCKSYVIVKNLSGKSSVYGISQDNTLVRIDDSIVTPTNETSMSLVKTNGDIKDVGVVASFKINVKGSELNSDQSIGLCNDNGNIRGFYARGYKTADKMLGGEIPAETYSNYTSRTRDMLDTRTNKDISHEANSAAARASVNNDSINNIKDGGNNMNLELDINELATRIAEKFPSINKNDLLNSFYKKAYTDETGKDDYELLHEAAIELIQQDMGNDKGKEDMNEDDSVPTAPFSPWSSTPRPRI